MRVAAIIFTFCAFVSSGLAAGADANRGSVRASASVSVSVPAVTGVELRVAAAGIDLNVFQTGSGVIVLRYGATPESTPVSLRGDHVQNAVAIGGGRWTTIRDRFDNEIRRISTRPQERGNLTYEIWHF